MITMLLIRRGIAGSPHFLCCLGFVLLTAPGLRGQNELQATHVQDEVHTPSVTWTTETTPNGLQMVRISSEDYTTATLAMDWSFKPALELQRAGIGEAWARSVSAQWASDSIGTGLRFSWSVTPSGFKGHGDAATVAEWGALMLEGINASPASHWERLQSDWIDSWNSAYHTPSKIAERVLQVKMFSLRHPFGELELPATLKAISEADVQYHATSYWHPNNAQLIFAGPTDMPGFPPRWVATVSAWPARELKKSAVSLPAKPRQHEAAIVAHDGDGFRTEASQLMRLKPDHPDALPLLLLAEHLALVAPDSFNVALNPLASTLGLTSTAPPARAIASIRTIQDEMALARQSPPSLQDLETWKQAAQTRTRELLRSPQTAAHLFIQNPDWFQALANDSWEAFTSRVRPNDIQRVAINYLRPNKLQIVSVGMLDSVRAVADAFVDAKHLAFYDENAQPVSPFGPVPDGLTALDVIQSHYAARGGKDVIQALQSCRRTGSMEATGGMAMRIEEEEIYGVGHRTSIALDGQTVMEQLVRPGEGRSMQLGKPHPMPKAEYARYERGLFAAELLDLAMREISAELVGSHSSANGEEWVVDLRQNNTLVQRLFFDAESGLLRHSEERRTGPTGPVEVFIDYEAYKAFDGILYATKITRETNNQRMTTTFTDVQPNARVSKNQFEWE